MQMLEMYNNRSSNPVDTFKLLIRLLMQVCRMRSYAKTFIEYSVVNADERIKKASILKLPAGQKFDLQSLLQMDRQ